MTFKRSQLRDPLFFKRNLAAIMAAQRRGEILDDIPKPPTMTKWLTPPPPALAEPPAPPPARSSADHHPGPR